MSQREDELKALVLAYKYTMGDITVDTRILQVSLSRVLINLLGEKGFNGLTQDLVIPGGFCK